MLERCPDAAPELAPGAILAACEWIGSVEGVNTVMSSKRSRSRQRNRALLLVAGIIVVGLVVTAVVLLATRWSSQAIDDPQAITIDVVHGSETITVSPYRVCDLFESEDACTITESNSAEVNLGPEDTAQVIVGTTVGANAWTLQRFFADEEVNSNTRYVPGESTMETIAGSTPVAGERTPLGVVEVSTALVGKNAAGEETTYGITWSIVNTAPQN